MKKSMLLSTIAMIVVVVVALSTATFAWFSSTTTAAIEGTATVDATKDFDIREYGSAWASTNSISLKADKVAPVAPMTSLETTKLITKGANVDAKYTEVAEDTKNWFKVNDKFEAFAAYTNAEVTLSTQKIATIAPFQVAKYDKEADNAAKVTITIKLAGASFNNDDMSALKAINVVLHFQSYTDAVADQWVGTRYNTATTGLITNPNTATASIAADTTGKTAAVEVASTGLVADGADTLTGIATSAGEGYYLLADDGLYRQISATVDFAANEYKLVTAYIWLDGYEALDNMMSKAFEVKIGFTTTNTNVA